MNKLVLLTLFLLLPLTGYSAVPYTFSNGTVADATEVNSNFIYFENKFSTSSGHDHDGSDSKQISAANLTGTLAAANGGTGGSISGMKLGDIVVAATSDNVMTYLQAGTSGQVLKSNGSGANPSWGGIASGRNFPAGYERQSLQYMGASSDVVWGNAFLARTNSADYDYTEATMTTDGAAHAFTNIANIIPVGVKAVVMKVYIKDDAISSLSIYSNAYNGTAFQQNIYIAVVNIANEITFVIPIGNDRIINYVASNTTFTNIFVKIVGFIY